MVWPLKALEDHAVPEIQARFSAFAPYDPSMGPLRLRDPNNFTPLRPQ